MANANSRLDNKPDFKKIEPKWQKWWAKEDIYAYDPKSKKPTFSIDSPPPTVSSDHIHEGHAMSYTQFEMVSRYKRMRGFNVFIPMGFDDNGLPTERFIEKKLKINAHKMSADEFRKKVTGAMKGVHKSMRADFDLLGHAYDWNYTYATSDSARAKAAQMSFIDLYKKKLVYRSEEPALWCPRCQTAAAQADIETDIRKGTLNYVDFKLKGGGKIQVATSRPELLGACVAMAVNPEDKTHKKYVGKTAIVPLFNHEVKILADERVDPEFGTGAVMICTFGDSTDVEWWKKYKLPLKIIITKDGKMNEKAGKYKGLKIAEAKEKVTKDLKKAGFVKKQETIEQSIGVCWRCPTPIEFVVTPQWFVKLLGHEKELIKQGSKVKWVPDFFRVRYNTWIEGLKWDWIISRQRPHGIPMPIWYCKDCKDEWVASEKDLPVDPRTYGPPRGAKCVCGSTNFVGEKDVFDTWMTSSLTPEFALGWGTKNDLMGKLFPMDLRPQAHDIIRTWAFYTITKAWYHFKKIPWKYAMVSGHVQDAQGRKISKSLGNSINFHGVVDRYSADQFRYWTATATLGEDLSFQEKELVRAGKILMKLWNACRFLEMHMDALPAKRPKLEILDEWILTATYALLRDYHKFFGKFEYMHARKLAELFFMHKFADDYLEMVKYRLYGDDKKSREAAVWTINTVLLLVLKLFAPITPHITEELYQALFKDREKIKSIHLTQIPDKIMIFKNAMDGLKIRKVVAAIRKYKSDNQIGLGKEIESLTVELHNPKALEKYADIIGKAIRVKKINLKPLKVGTVLKDGTDLKVY